MQFSLRRNKKIRNKIQLVSLHIPKTAGTSFRNMLKSVYGDEAVARLDIPLRGKQVKLNEEAYDERMISSSIKVVHGHFSPAQIYDLFEVGPDVPFITWLRNPVDRVISNFHYLEKRLMEELAGSRQGGRHLTRRMQRNLLEYAADEINRNIMHKYVEHLSLDSFYFVGIQEYFEEDVLHLSQKMNWPTPTVLHHNSTGKAVAISETDREKIASFNAKDVALYELGLTLRAQRTQS